MTSNRMTATDERTVLRDVTDRSDAEWAAGDLSDTTLERLLRVVVFGLSATVIVTLVAAGAVWVVADDSAPQPMNAVDVGFLRDMLDHHEQALLISEIYLDERAVSGVAPYAREVILYQQRDIDRMEAWLAEAGYPRGAPDRMTMKWMGMSVPVAEMAGMQTEEWLDRLDGATGEEADRLFLVMMSDHHRGGIHMAEYAAANGASEEITEFAAAVARNQTIEINEYLLAADRLGLIPER